MRYNRHLSHNDYENLFSGKVKYLIGNHTKLGYGPKCLGIVLFIISC